jgi:MFS superfamily sulfate permease-like transporter
MHDPEHARTMAVEKPQNGLAGLKHWRYDMLAGLLVSMISVPFSLGIAVASGAPPICGLTSAIIAGFVLPFLGGSYVTISGPAAGLAPALLASMILLGHRPDDVEEAKRIGYPLLLGAICMVGVVQIIISKLKAAKFSAVFPSAVVEGMLGAIGLLIIVKQLPFLFGESFTAHDFFPMLAEVPSHIRTMDPTLFVVAMASLALIFLLAAAKARWMKAVPPQVIVVAIGIVVGMVLGLNGKALIKVPDDPFNHGIVLPNFRGLWSDRSLWWPLLTIVVTLTLIDGVESLATVKAIDKIDPFRRKSCPHRTLTAMGVSNICSSVVGGLTIIPGGVKSTACVVGGGRTQWANFYNACFLLLFLFVGQSVINRIPLCVLAAVLIYTGYKLCKPAIWRHMAHIGPEQLLLFGFTVVVTLATDLLVGIIAGIVLKLAITLYYAAGDLSGTAARPALLRRIVRSLASFPDLFRSPVVARESSGLEYHVHFGRPLVCFNGLHVNDELEKIPAGVTKVNLHFGAGVTMIDHTSCENLLNFAEEFERSGQGKVEMVGLGGLGTRSPHESSMRLARVPPVPVPVPVPALATADAGHLAPAAENQPAQAMPHGAEELLEGTLALTEPVD